MNNLKIAILNEINNLPIQTQRNIKQKAKTSKRIDLNIVFAIPLRKSYTIKKKNELRGKAHTITPDLDNLIKNILDRGDGILWSDDKNIYKITAKKIWEDKAFIKLLVNYN